VETEEDARMRITSPWDMLGMWKVFYKYHEVSLGRKRNFSLLYLEKLALKEDD
jgi:hypothetical protein